MKKSTILGILMVLGTTLGCTPMAIRVTENVAKPLDAERDESCEVRFFAASAPFLDRCETLARVSARDTGLTRTSSCGTLQVRERFREIGCQYGADAAVASRIKNPISTCAEAEATLYRCGDDVLPPRPPIER